MAKDLNAGIITELDAQQKRPRILVTLIDANQYVTLRYVLAESNITFPNGGTTWTAKTMDFPGVSQSIEGQIDRLVIKLDDVARDVSAYIDTFNFKGGELKVWRIYMDSTTGLAPADGSFYDELFEGKIDTIDDINYEWVVLNGTIGKPLVRKTLTKTFNKECDHIYGDVECNVDGNSSLVRAKGRADSGSNTTLVDANLWQKDDYWNSGQILITKSETVYVATVTDFADGTVTFADIGTAVDSTCLYTMIINSVQMQIGKADSGTVSTLVDNALTQGDDFWNHGIIEVTKDDVTYRRNVSDFDAGTDTVTLDVALPVAIDNTCGYVLVKGCDKVWETCQSNNIWGPESDNKANFLGWTHIGIANSGGAPASPKGFIWEPSAPGGAGGKYSKYWNLN